MEPDVGLNGVECEEGGNTDLTISVNLLCTIKTVK